MGEDRKTRWSIGADLLGESAYSKDAPTSTGWYLYLSTGSMVPIWRHIVIADGVIYLDGVRVDAFPDGEWRKGDAVSE